MICFPDTNAIFKLAGFDLLQEAFVVLGTTPNELFILRETRQMCRGNTLRNTYGRQAVTRVETFLQRAGGVAITVDPDEHEILTYTDGIDDGEAILFAATKGHSDFRILTDDKKSLRALAEASDCQPVFDRVVGKVVCLEQLLLMLMARQDYEQIRRKLLLSFPSVRALQQTFGTNQQAEQSHVEAALQAAVDQLRRETNYILVAP